MKTTTKTVYEAFDGTSFDTAADCKAYEKDNAHLAIVGLTVEQALASEPEPEAERPAPTAPPVEEEPADRPTLPGVADGEAA